MLDYTGNNVPAGYVCGTCGAHGVKLWRVYQTMHITLRCATCAATESKVDIQDMGPDGKYTSDLGRTNSIKWYVPAVPDEECETYWGYTSVPQLGVEWWKRLPNAKVETRGGA
jgi:hypothetical protein